MGICYRPPQVCVRKFIQELHSLLEKLHNMNKIVYLLGDFNINTFRSATSLNKAANDFSNLFASYFFQPLIDKPTREVNSSSTLLDNIYTNESDSGNICTSGIMKTDFSDHFSIFSMSNHKINTKSNKTQMRRNFSESNKAKFYKAIKKIEWDTIYKIDDAQRAFEYFQGVILELFEKVFPLRKIEIKYSNKLPWVTTGLRISIKQKHILQNKFEKDPTEENKLLYKRHRNLLTTLMRNSERVYYENQLELQKHDLRKSWKIMKEIIGKVNESDENNFECIIEGSLTKDVQQIAKAFNNYFTEIGPNLASKIKSRVNPMSYISSSIENSMFLPHIDETEISTIIKNIKNSSSGWDNIPPVLLKSCITSYIKPLTYIVNKSFETGMFPDPMKLAKIVPIFKSGDKKIISNYRPISVLTFFSKIFEKAISKYLLEFLDSNNTLYKYQFSFRKKFSTSHAIISIVEKINNALSSGKCVAGVFLDFRKAYDTVDHSILLKKLYAYGIRGTILNWFKSYLSNREQFASINNTYSDKNYISCGIPQGSVLGPLLFLIYINDLPNVSKKLYSILFADDTSVFLEGDNLNTLSTVINEELNKLSIWLASNKLTLNTDKSHYVIFHRARLKQTKIEIKLSDISLKRVSFTKFLGVIIDEKLSFTRHISYIKNKISKAMGIIIKARKYLNRKSLLNLYHAFVFPYLTYCIEIWGNASDIHLDALLKVQKKNYSNHYLFFLLGSYG